MTTGGLSRDEANLLLTMNFGSISPGCWFPMTREEFKTLFRKACKILHPDVAGKEFTDRFVKVKDFYEKICSQNPSWAFTDYSEKILRTSSGDILSDLGIGLGPNTNGRDCDRCNHKGYTEEHLVGTARCKWCSDGWAYAQPCNRCGGTGSFKKNGVEKGVCYPCKGSGIHSYAFVVKCRVCRGGYIDVPKGTVVYNTCYNCKGSGEIQIYNPVIVKGRLAL